MSAEISPKKESHGVLNKMRNNTVVVMWILVFSFVGMIIFSWGMDILGFTSPAQKGIIGIINGDNISYQRFNSVLQNELERYRTQLGQIPQGQFQTNLINQVWNNIVDEMLVHDAIAEMGIFATDQEVVEEIRYRPLPQIRENPEFKLDDGTFDQAKWETYLRQDQSGTVLMLEAQLRANLPLRKLQNMIVSTVRVTEEEIRQAFIEQEVNAKAEYIVAKASGFSDVDIPVSEQEISNYYRENKNNFTEAESRALKYVLFDTNPTQQDSLNTEDKIKTVYERAIAGEDFAKLAVEYSMSGNAADGGQLGVISQGNMIKEVDEALFKRGVKADDIIGPVRTNSGTQIIKVERVVKSGSTIDSLQIRNILINLVPSDETLNTAERNANGFSIDAEEDGFETAAQNRGYSVLETAPFAKGGFIPGFGVNYDISRFAEDTEFDASNPEVSRPIETPQGFGVFALASVTPERTLTMQEVRDEIVQIIQSEKQVDMAREKMASIHQKIKNGMSFEDAAKEESMEITTSPSFKANDFISGGVGRDTKFAAAALALEVGEISGPVTGNAGAYLIRLLEKDAFDEEKYQEMKEQIKNNLLSRKRNAAYGAFISQLRDKADIEDFRTSFYRL